MFGDVANFYVEDRLSTLDHVECFTDLLDGGHEVGLA